jgi:hypothetical protein
MTVTQLAVGPILPARPWRLPALVGVALGLLAFAADLVPGIPGGVLLGLASSGAAWGVPAAVLGFRSRGPRAAVSAGVLSLLTATAVYYLLIATVSRRWAVGSPEPGAAHSLGSGFTSVITNWIAWSAIGVVVGAALALLGYVIRRGSGRAAALAAAVMAGALLAESSSVLLVITGAPDLLGADPARFATLAVGIVWGVAAPVVLLRQRGERNRWRVFAPAAAAMIVVGAGAWTLLDLARVAVSHL